MPKKLSKEFKIKIIEIDEILLKIKKKISNKELISLYKDENNTEPFKVIAPLLLTLPTIIGTIIEAISPGFLNATNPPEYLYAYGVMGVSGVGMSMFASIFLHESNHLMENHNRIVEYLTSIKY